jgi:hypothetical protein
MTESVPLEAGHIYEVTAASNWGIHGDAATASVWFSIPDVNPTAGLLLASIGFLAWWNMRVIYLLTGYVDSRKDPLEAEPEGMADVG